MGVLPASLACCHPKGSSYHSIGKSIALGYVHGENGVDKDFILSGTYEIDVGGRR